VGSWLNWRAIMPPPFLRHAAGLLLAGALVSCGTPASPPPFPPLPPLLDLPAATVLSGPEEHRSAVLLNPAITYASQRGLVDVRAVIPDIVCDLRYGTKKNVTGQVLYPPDMPCLLNERTAEKLRRAQEILRGKGFGLKIWDAWRPPEVQVELFRYGGHTNMFLDPHIAWSFHCSGTAVDVTLVDKKGHELSLPTYFDVGGPKANIYAPIRDNRTRQNVYTLQTAMTEAGFLLLDAEWWHFDDRDFHDATTRLPVVFAQEIGVKLPALK
jgi:D-alanyl-D-alanine dipeptidase